MDSRDRLDAHINALYLARQGRDNALIHLKAVELIACLDGYLSTMVPGVNNPDPVLKDRFLNFLLGVAHDAMEFKPNGTPEEQNTRLMAEIIPILQIAARSGGPDGFDNPYEILNAAQWAAFATGSPISPSKWFFKPDGILVKMDPGVVSSMRLAMEHFASEPDDSNS